MPQLDDGRPRGLPVWAMILLAVLLTAAVSGVAVAVVFVGGAMFRTTPAPPPAVAPHVESPPPSPPFDPATEPEFHPRVATITPAGGRAVLLARTTPLLTQGTVDAGRRAELQQAGALLELTGPTTVEVVGGSKSITRVRLGGLEWSVETRFVPDE